MKTVNFIVLIIFVIFLFVQKVSACSCMPLPPIYQSYESADAVFIGKVVNSNEPKEKGNYEGGDIFLILKL